MNLLHDALQAWEQLAKYAASEDGPKLMPVEGGRRKE